VLDFSDPTSTDVINAWASDATNGKIDDVIQPPIDASTAVLLINALAFRGSWTDQFDPADTEPAPFHTADGSTVDVPMMTLEDVYMPFEQNDEFTAADLRYGAGAFAMTVVVPHDPAGLPSLMAAMDGEAWGELTDRLETLRIRLRLPRFSLEYQRSLAEDLATLGMPSAFDESVADFSRMAPGRSLFINDVTQKAFLKVDEEGSDAAAVTVVELFSTSFFEPGALTADRPFLFAIRERFSGTILFLGAVVEPPEI